MNPQLQKSMERNVKLYIWIQPLLGLLFTIPIWVAFQQRFLSYSGMALMEGSSFLINMIFELPSGVLADLIGRKKTVILGWLFIVLGYFIEGMSTNLIMMVSGFFIVAIGGSFVSGADEALFYDSLKALGREDEFAKINTRGQFLYRIAMIFGIFSGGWLYSINVGLPYFMRGLGVLGATILALFLLEPYIDSEKFSFKGYMNKLKIGVMELVKSNYTKALTIYYVIIASISWSCLYYFNNPLANDVGYTPQEQSILFSLIYICTTSFLYFIVSKKKLINKRQVFISFPIILILGLIPGIFATKILIIPMLILVIIAGGARFSFLNGYTNEEISSGNRATSLSALSLLVSLSCAVLIGSLGYIQQQFGTQLVFTILGLIVLLLGVPATIYVNRHLN